MIEIVFINICGRLVSHNEHSDFFIFDKNDIKITFYIGLYKIVIEKVCNIPKFLYRN